MNDKYKYFDYFGVRVRKGTAGTLAHRAGVWETVDNNFIALNDDGEVKDFGKDPYAALRHAGADRAGADPRRYVWPGVFPVVPGVAPGLDIVRGQHLIYVLPAKKEEPPPRIPVTKPTTRARVELQKLTPGMILVDELGRERRVINYPQQCRQPYYCQVQVLDANNRPDKVISHRETMMDVLV